MFVCLLGFSFPFLTEASKKAQYAKRINSCALFQTSPLRNKDTFEKSLAAVLIWKVGKDINVIRDSALMLKFGILICCARYVVCSEIFFGQFIDIFHPDIYLTKFYEYGLLPLGGPPIIC